MTYQVTKICAPFYSLCFFELLSIFHILMYECCKMSKLVVNQASKRDFKLSKTIPTQKGMLDFMWAPLTRVMKQAKHGLKKQVWLAQMFTYYFWYAHGNYFNFCLDYHCVPKEGFTIIKFLNWLWKEINNK